VVCTVVDDRNGNLAIHSFLKKKGTAVQRDILGMILRQAAETVDVPDGLGTTPLMIAAGNRSLCSAFKHREKNGNADGNNPQDKEETLHEALSRLSKFGIGGEGQMAQDAVDFISGVDTEPPSILEMILVRGVDVRKKDENGDSALFHAARAGALEHVKLLAGIGSMSQDEMDRALFATMEEKSKSDLRVMKHLLLEAHPRARPAHFGPTQETLLIAAARGGNFDCCDWLLTHMPFEFLVARDKLEQTALHVAALYKQNNVAKLLMNVVIKLDPASLFSRTTC